jgi:hypothetical protein
MANYEGSALGHTYSAIERIRAHRKWKVHARVRLSALDQPNRAETLKLVYKYHYFSIVNVRRHARGAVLCQISCFLDFLSIEL